MSEKRRVRLLGISLIVVMVLFIVVMSLLLWNLLLKPTEVKHHMTLNTMGGYVFPDDAVCDAPSQYSDGRVINTLNVEYLHVDSGGALVTLTSGCNAYNDSNVASVKAHSNRQFVTVSGDSGGFQVLISDTQLTNTFISTVQAFLSKIGFTGVELDFEDFGSWTSSQYASYVAFVKRLSTELHSTGHLLAIDCPAISDQTYQSYYPHWSYKDFDGVQVELRVMAYDYEYDQGAGNPIAPIDWITNICKWTRSQITDPSRITIILNSYGYHGVRNKYAANRDTYSQSKAYYGFNTASRDASSGEMTWSVGGEVYYYTDSETLNQKVTAVLNSGTGINNIAIFHLGGGNKWPTVTPPPTPVSTPTVTSDVSPALSSLLKWMEAELPSWYAANFDSTGKYIGGSH